MKNNKSGNEEVVSAINFLQRTQNGEYCIVDVNSYKGKRINVPVIDTEDEFYYYSISN